MKLLNELQDTIKDLQQKNIKLSSMNEMERNQNHNLAVKLSIAEEALKKECMKVEALKGGFKNYTETCKYLFQSQIERCTEMMMGRLTHIDKKNRRNI